jgi:hypothetical protein
LDARALKVDAHVFELGARAFKLNAHVSGWKARTLILKARAQVSIARVPGLDVQALNPNPFAGSSQSHPFRSLM